MKRRYLDVAREAALAAGKLLMNSYGKLEKSQISTKSRNDFVTEIDKRSEKLIISIIRKYFPDHSILAEESGMNAGAEETLPACRTGRRATSLQWIIDPLDGTSNYIHQFPIFSISIGVMEKGEFVAGVVYDPIHRELFNAEKGKGAYLNRARIHVSKTRRLADSLMATGIPFRARERFDQYMGSFSKISLASAGMRRGGSAALDLAYVACGRFEGFWELNLSPWDIAAGALLIQEAGGRISDVWGRNDFLKNGDILASNGRIHNELRSITSGIFAPKSGP